MSSAVALRRAGSPTVRLDSTLLAAFHMAAADRSADQDLGSRPTSTPAS